MRVRGGLIAELDPLVVQTEENAEDIAFATEAVAGEDSCEPAFWSEKVETKSSPMSCQGQFKFIPGFRSDPKLDCCHFLIWGYVLFGFENWVRRIDNKNFQGSK